MFHEMKAVDLKLISSTLKVIALSSLAFIFIIYAPQHRHHVLLLLGVGLTLYGARSLYKYTQQEKWIETEAKIKHIEEHEEEVAISEYSKLKYHYPIIEYEYSANGMTYSGNVVAAEKENIWVPEVNNWGEPTPKEKRWWLTLKPGDVLPAYVKPSEESKAVLIKGIGKSRRSHHLALIAGGAILGVIWLFLAITT